MLYKKEEAMWPLQAIMKTPIKGTWDKFGLIKENITVKMVERIHYMKA